MTLDEALRIADYPVIAGLNEAERALLALATEVRRYRAAVEVLQPFDLDGGYDDECGVSRAHCSDGAYLDADEVLAILEPKP